MSISPWIRSLADLTGATKDAANRLEREWDPDSAPDTVAAAAVARAFGAALPVLGNAEIEAVAKTVEHFLTGGDERIANAIATGFLESLLAQASAGTIDFQRIAWALGSESLKYCQAWDKFTGAKTDGL